MRKKIIAGNWKMNKKYGDAKELMMRINTFMQTHSSNCDVIIAPPFPYLQKAEEIFANKKVKISAQNMSDQLSGAYTGEVSAEMLQSIGVDCVILGHSERRQYHAENDETLFEKIKIALEHNLTPIYCCGELLEDREAGKEFEVNKTQIETALFGLTEEQISKVIIAYEPVWAIGTGKTATPEQAQEIHNYIRGIIAEKFSQEIADSISILYGGSMKPDNARELISQPDIDGGLIGGASLNAEDFTKLIAICN
ncbi:MAG: triose-phosphate isomerase [Flavobacteriales bacterium]|nr:triose-phosphate isomerase [Flavobacteriales bacterium]